MAHVPCPAYDGTGAVGSGGSKGAGTPQLLAGATACRGSLVLETPGV